VLVRDRPQLPRRPVEPGIERTVTLTDAVVAIAMTLLILPLVEVSGEVEAGHLGDFFRDNTNLFVSFVVSFLVIYVFWGAHGHAFARLEAAERARDKSWSGGEDQAADAGPVVVPMLRQLNMWWLLVIAFLPFPTAVVGGDLTTSSAPLYIGTMTVLSLLTSGISVAVDRAVPEAVRLGAMAWLTPAVFAICTVLSSVNADLGLYALLSLVAVRVFEVRSARRG
jgi:uncharacterized membrane protein